MSMSFLCVHRELLEIRPTVSLTPAFFIKYKTKIFLLHLYFLNWFNLFLFNFRSSKEAKNRRRYCRRKWNRAGEKNQNGTRAGTEDDWAGKRKERRYKMWELRHRVFQNGGVFGPRWILLSEKIEERIEILNVIIVILNPRCNKRYNSIFLQVF